MAAGTVCLVGAACAGAHTSSGAPATYAPPLAPRFAHSVVLKAISGKVLIHVPGGPSGFTQLTAPRLVPVGTVVDTNAGRVSLTSATPAPTQFQTGQFFLGTFQVEQTRAQGALVSLVIRDSLARSACGAPAAHTAALSKRILGLLRGSAMGHFRTVGRFAAATVRGTNWGVRDRCDGTLTVVRTGVVVVRDFRLHTNVIVRAGQTYLAKAP